MSNVPPERRKKSLKEIEKKQTSQKKKQEASLKLVNDIDSFIHEKSQELGVPAESIVNEILSNKFAVIEFNETNGKASLVYNWGATASGAVGEVTKESEDIIKEYRDLRENFAPVSAGVEWHRDFTSGGGFVIHVDDIKDEHKKKMADEIRTFCGNVYQDEFMFGLDSVLDVMIDIAITDGVCAAEIVYSVETNFIDYITEFEDVTVTVNNSKKIVKVPVFKEPDWKTLAKITRLKVIEDTYTRLRPYRHPISGEVLYFTLDEKSLSKDPLDPYNRISQNTSNTEVVKFLPWEIFWMPWNPRGTNMKGMSQIKAVYQVAKFVKAIQTAVGVGFSRWANKKYFFVCTPEGTLIWTPEGYRKIETIQVGDKVWDKHSTAEVLHTFKNPFKGNLITVKPKMLEEVSFTPNHPIKVAKKIRLRTNKGHSEYLTKFVVQDNYKRADELTVDDWLIVPKITESKDIWIDFPFLEHDEGYGKGRNPDILPSQYLSEDLAKLFGWYIAEGSCQDYAIQFSLNINETHYAQEILDLAMLTLGLKGVIYPHPENNGLQVVFCSKILADFLKENFGIHADGKHLPENFIYCKPEILHAMISRIIMGDGNLTSKDHWVRLKLNSYMLQKQLQLALLKLGHRASIFKIKRSSIGYINGRQINQNDAWVLTWNENNQTIAEDEDNHYFKIGKLTKTPHEGYVYNLHTTSNEYYTPFITHNCGTDKRPWGKKHFDEFMKSMERMLKNNWVGIPVPAGFEVKEIGGEQSVFEGKDLLNFLTGMICAGMQYPRDFLESGRTQASDKSWLAWTVRYGRSQQLIKRSIENQLFKRHLWCVEGKTHKLSLKGKQVAKQEDVPTYIPRLMWKAEGQWLKDAKLKSLKSMLDAANPVDPVLKLAVEMEMAQTIGVGDLDWTPITKFFDVQMENKLIEAKRSLITAKEQLSLDEEMQKSGKVKELLKTQFENKLEQAKNPTQPPTEPKQPETPTTTPQTPEEKLLAQTEKRGASGVSKTLHEQPSKKGQSKEVGGTRQPERTPK